MSSHRALISVLCGLSMIIWPNFASSRSCFGIAFRVKIEVLSCEPGRTVGRYGLIDLKILGRTLEVHAEESIAPARDRTQLAEPADLTPVSQVRAYTFPTGNGYLPPYDKIQTCETIVGRQFEMPTHTCFCSIGDNCKELFLQPPSSWRSK
jgi:hypothetical protein